MVNPKQIKHFSRMMMTVTKTDPKDACMIAMYGEKMNPPVYKMPSETVMLLKQKKTIIRQLKKQLTASKNLKKLPRCASLQDKNGMKALDKTISFLASQIESLESELADLASSEFDRQVKLLTSIKGIGITLATALIVATGGFSYFNNAKSKFPVLSGYARPTNSPEHPYISKVGLTETGMRVCVRCCMSPLGRHYVEIQPAKNVTHG